MALEGRTVLVTGATSGVGRATAARLLAEGARVIATGRRAETLDCPGGGDRLLPLAADLSRPGAAVDLLAAIPAGWAPDALIHAAGHDAGGNAPFHEVSAADRAAKLAVNLAAFADLAHALLPGFLAAGRGDMVAIGSIAGREPVAGLADYGMSKRGLSALMAGLRLDYAATPLRFVEIVPGVVRTGFAAGRWAGDTARADGFYARFPEVLEAEDVAEAALWALTRPAHVAVDEIVLRPARR